MYPLHEVPLKNVRTPNKNNQFPSSRDIHSGVVFDTFEPTGHMGLHTDVFTQSHLAGVHQDKINYTVNQST